MNLNYMTNESQPNSRTEWKVITNLESKLDKVEFDNDRVFSLGYSPFSPLEVNLTALSNQLLKTRGHNLKITKDSVNYVLLDDEPELYCSSLLVSHKIESSESRNSKFL